MGKFYRGMTTLPSTIRAMPIWRARSGYRERVLKAIQSAGFDVWPKMFVNLRSSIITEFEEMGISEKTIDAIFGNSSKVRKRYYIKHRQKEEFERVLKCAKLPAVHRVVGKIGKKPFGRR